MGDRYNLDEDAAAKLTRTVSKVEKMLESRPLLPGRTQGATRLNSGILESMWVRVSAAAAVPDGSVGGTGGGVAWLAGSPGGSLTAGTYYFVTTWTDGTNEYRLRGEAFITIGGADNLVNVSAPTPSPPVAGVTGWNCYVGTSINGPFYLQNTGGAIGTGSGFAFSIYMASGALAPWFSSVTYTLVEQVPSDAYPGATVDKPGGRTVSGYEVNGNNQVPLTDAIVLAVKMPGGGFGWWGFDYEADSDTDPDAGGGNKPLEYYVNANPGNLYVVAAGDYDGAASAANLWQVAGAPVVNLIQATGGAPLYGENVICMPIAPERSMPIAKLGVQVNNPGYLGYTCYLGIYDSISDTDIRPQNLLASNSVSLDVGGFLTVDIGLTLGPNRLYWAALYVHPNTGAMGPGFGVLNPGYAAHPIGWFVNGLEAFPIIGTYRQSWTSTSLPDPFNSGDANVLMLNAYPQVGASDPPAIFFLPG